MAYLVGDVTVMNSIEKEYEGRKYFVCQGFGSDKAVYKFSTPFEDHPKEGDKYQMMVEPSTRDFKPYCRFQKVK